MKLFALLVLLLLLPLAARAQVLYSVDGTAETPVGSTFNVGSVAVGVAQNTRFRARNLGNAAIKVATLALSGSNFTIASPLSRPDNIAPGSFLDIDVNFLAGPPAQYSAQFQINSISVLMLATSVPATTLTVLSPCTGPDPVTGAIDFGRVLAQLTQTCTFLLQNPNEQALNVSVTVIGFGFVRLSQSFTVAPGGSVSFSVVFSPGVGALFSGTLTVDTRVFSLTGAGLPRILPTPMLQFDSAIPTSGQQITLTMKLPSPAAYAASGSVTLAFQPSDPFRPGDTAVYFMNGQVRSMPYTIQQGDTQIALNGKSSAVFQTGTTAGRIVFTLSGDTAFASDPTTILTLAPAAISVETATATRQAGSLDIQLWGFDNTYTAGSMTFTFYDLSGKPLTPVSANFLQDFTRYFGSAPGTGSTFQMRVTFPVSGDSGLIGAVDVQLANSAAVTSIAKLPFQ
jgi:hypothetical protein